MDQASSDGDVVRLEGSLDMVITLLGSVGEEHWQNWFEQARVEIGHRDAHGLIHINAAYGGMGSFTDLVIHPANGHRVADAAVAGINERLSQLSNDIYVLARSLLHDANL